ncbi:S1C family serine protease [Demequina capsici]|uniref:Trypsin-like peptidase domain-containing protein n=1 Tax=Demequina capsici TaxID=3075620 RepID=A0AA96J8K3_9MICO|nr:trypsin-like peptidase domain-containing protein [Demequina sp. OYTSA14]WNM25560.1 trypsin-like peptidase domain-containing protein [Demequina sp. OYTSA14]
MTAQNMHHDDGAQTGYLTIALVPEARYSRRRKVIGSAVGAAAVSALAITGLVVGANGESTTALSSGSSAQTANLPSLGDSSSGASGGTYAGPRGGYGGTGTWPGSDSGSSSSTASVQQDATTASSSESTGIVLIDTVLGYDQAQAAGTGMILTSDGLVLTNNHVIDGATEITVTDASTGKTYTATVVGTDATSDVALLQLQDASGLTTVTLDNEGDPAVADDVTAVGNASGGGVLMAADGTVTSVNSSVTTSSEYWVSGETLTGMIEFQADVVSGDSGGALLDSQGEVVGMTTAASTGSATVTAYAIPIDDAMSIVDQILAGDASGDVTLGYPAFLGVGIASDATMALMPGGSGSSTAGAQIAYVYDGTPAASAGLVAGDVITAIDGTAITSGDQLSTLIAEHSPGDSVTLTWTDTSGVAQAATVTLASGPAA